MAVEIMNINEIINTTYLKLYIHYYSDHYYFRFVDNVDDDGGGGGGELSSGKTNQTKKNEKMKK